jgi:hypothetical protein
MSCHTLHIAYLLPEAICTLHHVPGPDIAMTIVLFSLLLLPPTSSI